MEQVKFVYIDTLKHIKIQIHIHIYTTYVYLIDYTTSLFLAYITSLSVASVIFTCQWARYLVLGIGIDPFPNQQMSLSLQYSHQAWNKNNYFRSNSGCISRKLWTLIKRQHVILCVVELIYCVSVFILKKSLPWLWNLIVLNWPIM